MGQHKREKALRKAKASPFLTLPAAALWSAALRYDGLTLKLWLLLHAAWTPTAHGGRPRAILPFDTAVNITGAGRSQIVTRLQRLTAQGLAWVIRKGTRPAGPGGARGVATVWGLPFRVPQETPPANLLLLPLGARRPSGKVRWNAGRLRQDARVLSHHAFRLLVLAVAQGDRNQLGGVVSTSPFEIAALVRLCNGFPARTGNRAMDELVTTQRLTVAQQAAGRRSALVNLARPYCAFEKLAPRPASLPPMVSSRRPTQARKPDD